MRRRGKNECFAPFWAGRLLAGLLAAAVAAALLFSVFYIAAEAGHDCTGEGCPICACIQRLEQAAQRLGTGGAARTASASAAIFLLSALPLCALEVLRATPAGQRVRMNN
ncbi:MAG: hypothetical protein LUD69_07545 [Oscillospiraceae bacterium]|nr:hypothetical protein [Oscillospiraceae bacterium]